MSPTPWFPAWHLNGDSTLNITPVNYTGKNTVILNSTAGMIGTPSITPNGVSVNLLINPEIKVHSILHLNNRDIQGLPPSFTRAGFETKEFLEEVGSGAAIQADGNYRIVKLDWTGDSRGSGNDWFGSALAIGTQKQNTPANASWN